MRGLQSTFPELQILAGNEAYLLDLLDAGGAGCISATVNVTHPLAGAIFARHATNDVGADQERLSRIRRTLMAHPTIPMLKQVMAWRTGRDGWLRLRPPLTPLSDPATTALREAATALDVLPAPSVE